MSMLLDHRHNALHWAYEYLGKPYIEGAEGPDAYDCWGLVRTICAKQIDCKMPLINIGRNDNGPAIAKALRGWVKVNPPYKEYDVLTMKNSYGRHIGICIKANGRLMFLHAEVPQVQVSELNRLNMFGYKEIQGWRYEQ